MKVYTRENGLKSYLYTFYPGPDCRALLLQTFLSIVYFDCQSLSKMTIGLLTNIFRKKHQFGYLEDILFVQQGLGSLKN